MIDVNLISFKKKNLFTDTLIYTGSVVVARGLGILIFPILVANMNESDLVHYDWVLTNVLLAVTFAVFGVDSAAGRMLADSESDHQKIMQLSLITIAPQTILSLVILFTILTNSDIPMSVLDVIIITVLLLASIFINQITNKAKWLLERNKVIVIQVSLGVSQALFLILVYMFGVLNFTTGLAAQMAGALFVAAYGMYKYNTGFPTLSIPVGLSAFFRKSATLGINTLLAGIYLTLEKNIIYQYTDTSASSLYLVHLKVVLLFTFGLSALQISVVPHLIKILHEKNIRFFYLNNVIITILIITCLGLFYLISPYIFEFFTKKHTFSEKILTILLLIQVIIIFNSLCETLLIYLEAYRIMLLLNMIHIGLFLILTFLFAGEDLLAIILCSLLALMAKLMLMTMLNIRYIKLVKA